MGVNRVRWSLCVYRPYLFVTSLLRTLIKEVKHSYFKSLALQVMLRSCDGRCHLYPTILPRLLPKMCLCLDPMTMIGTRHHTPPGLPLYPGPSSPNAFRLRRINSNLSFVTFPYIYISLPCPFIIVFLLYTLSRTPAI